MMAIAMYLFKFFVSIVSIGIIIYFFYAISLSQQSEIEELKKKVKDLENK